MAILFSQADGSDQHYDTYEEFEQAMILMKRLNGEEVPQDLLDEAKEKRGGKEAKPIKVEIDGTALVEKMREVQAGLEDKLNDWVEEHGRVEFISDDKLDEESYEDESAIEVGDKVRVVSAEDGTDSGYHGFRIGSAVEVKEVYGNGKVDAYDGIFYQTLLPHHFEKVEDSPTEFRTGDIVKVTETFEDSLGDKAHGGEILEYDDTCPKTFVGLVFVENNHDKLQLVCRKEDRKDIEL